MDEVPAAVTRCLWRLQWALGAALGVLPVTGGWPPRPWPRGWAYLAAACSAGLFLFTKVLDHVLTRIAVVESTGAGYTTVTVALIVVRVVVERFSCAHLRTAWCELAQCVFLYTTRHPLSRDAWRDLLGTGLLGMLVSLCSLASYMLFIISSNGRTFLQDIMGVALSLIGPLLFGLSYFLVLHPVAVLKALAADLRHVLYFMCHTICRNRRQR
ncbi:Maturase K [Frankliniella fusca]|uniref:Maturase K n=1 Tax=Frankliniella fusca TaxID=407009 RepID=A0AAE1LQT2_9NEOP|nr:Maturase K [Frankliniella fusca]